MQVYTRLKTLALWGFAPPMPMVTVYFLGDKLQFSLFCIFCVWTHAFSRYLGWLVKYFGSGEPGSRVTYTRPTFIAYKCSDYFSRRQIFVGKTNTKNSDWSQEQQVLGGNFWRWSRVPSPTRSCLEMKNPLVRNKWWWLCKKVKTDKNENPTQLSFPQSKFLHLEAKKSLIRKCFWMNESKFFRVKFFAGLFSFLFGGRHLDQKAQIRHKTFYA